MLVFSLHVYSLGHRTPRSFDLWPGPTASQHNEHVISGACETLALILTRTAGGGAAPDQLFQRTPQSLNTERKMSGNNQYRGSIVVSFDLSIII